MSLRAALQRIVHEWPTAVNEQFAQHPLANFVRQDFKRVVAPIVDEFVRSYRIMGSAGAGLS